MKCMELSLEDWFPILPRSWLHLYSMPVAQWPLVLLWCGRKKHRPGWGREKEKAEGWQKVKQSTMEKGVWDFSCGVGFLEGWEDGMWECKETGMSLQGAARNQWSHHLTDLWGFAPRAGRWWVGRKEAGLRGKGSGDGGGLGEGMMVAWADRDISAASVISRRLAAARGHRWAHESTGTW